MKFLYNIFILYFKPAKYIMAMYVYFKFLKIYKQEVRNQYGNDVDVFRLAINRLAENQNELTDFLEMYMADNIKTMFFISTLFWVVIFKLIFIIF